MHNNDLTITNTILNIADKIITINSKMSDKVSDLKLSKPNAHPNTISAARNTINIWYIFTGSIGSTKSESVVSAQKTEATSSSSKTIPSLQLVMIGNKPSKTPCDICGTSKAYTVYVPEKLLENSVY